jgi:cytochrome c oxidase assembly protein subunit 15
VQRQQVAAGYLCTMFNLERSIRRAAWTSLIFVYLVITAGSVVRMTGSGMGCPDWPKCFGYTIPPTDAEEVTWSADRDFKRGQMIVHDWDVDGQREEKLLKAKEDFTTGNTFEPEHWEVYTKHDYTLFNPTHTWIEFINRLIGALTGIPVLALFVLAFIRGVKHKKWMTFLLSFGVLFMLGFEAWLGKLVVDGNLIPGSITIHMFGSIVLVFLLLLIIRREQKNSVQVRPAVFYLIVASLVLTLVQILLGTQVREEIDIIAKTGLDRAIWISELPMIFEIHRSFSWVVLLLTAGWLWMTYRRGTRFPEMAGTLVLLCVQLGAGILLVYAGMPKALQPVHLVGGILMFGVLWSAALKAQRQRA